MSAVEAWKTQPLRELAKLNYGKDLSAVVDVAGSIPIHGTSESVRWGRGYLYDGASVILGRKGSIDRVKYVEGKFWTIDTAYYLSDFEEALPKWLYYFLSTINLRSLNEATGVPSLSRDRLYMIEVPKPPLSEQAKIAEVLSTVDRGIEQTEALIAKQQRIKTGLMADLLTRGIDEHGNLRSEATHAFKDSPLGRIPVEWEVKTLADFADVDRGKFTHRPRNDPRFYGGEYPFIQTGDVTSNVGRSFIDHSQTLNLKGTKVSKKFPMGTIAITIAANIADTAILGKPMYFPDSVVGAVVAAPNSMRFVELMIRRWKPLLEQLAPQSAQKNINLDTLRPLPIPQPDSVEQVRIATCYDQLDQNQEKLEGTLQKLRSLKTSLMQDLLTGKVRVTGLLDTEVVG